MKSFKYPLAWLATNIAICAIAIATQPSKRLHSPKDTPSSSKTMLKYPPMPQKTTFTLEQLAVVQPFTNYIRTNILLSFVVQSNRFYAIQTTTNLLFPKANWRVRTNFFSPSNGVIVFDWQEINSNQFGFIRLIEATK